MCDEAGFDSDLCDTVYWVAMLRYIGCTGHAHEVATVFGDEIAIRAQTLVHDAANPEEVMRDAVAYATANHPREAHDEVAEQVRTVAFDWAVHNFASGCEAGDMLLERLDFGTDVRDALAFTFERWNGNGFPKGHKGEAIPLAMRIVHVSHDMEAIGRRFSPEQAIEAAADRRDRTYDPELADLFAVHGSEWFERLDRLEPWDAVLDLEPKPYRVLAGSDLDAALVVMADFIDLKSPFMAGHSRRCAELAADAAELLGSSADDVAAIRRAAFVHELGTTAVPNSIWDKPGALTRAERDRVEVHPMLTELMLARIAMLSDLNPIAACHHEKADGSGYHKRLQADAIAVDARVLAATDIYVGLTSDRADRPAVTGDAAARELERLAASGALDARATEAVIAAAGHKDLSATESRRLKHPAGLTDREMEVLRLAARGFTTRDIGERLFISPKTADHHIQHVYTKIGVSTRAAAALWAMQNGVVG